MGAGSEWAVRCMLLAAWSANTRHGGVEAFAFPRPPHPTATSSAGTRSTALAPPTSTSHRRSRAFSSPSLVDTSPTSRRGSARRKSGRFHGVMHERSGVPCSPRQAPAPGLCCGERARTSRGHRRKRSTLGPLFAEDQGWLDALKSIGDEPGLPLGPSSKKMSGLGGMAAEDTRVAQNNALKEWMGENGVWVFDRSDWGVGPHALSVAVDTVDENENETAGRGMIANREIKEGDELFTLPIDLLLTKDAARKEFGADIITDDLSEYIAIALLLVHEKAKGKGSFWSSYIGVLPTVEDVYPTYLWAEEDLTLLEGSPVIAATESMRRKLEAEYATVESDLLDKFPKILRKEVHTYAEFQWAFSMLFSRAIRLGGLSTGEAVALVPYADLFNHNPFANSYIDARQQGFFSKTDEVVVYADRSYKKMEQVYISYGPKGNSDLLLLYGFSLDRNPYNSVDVTISLDENDELYEKKKMFLEEAGLPPTKAFPLYNDRYPDELLQYLRLIQLNKDQLRGRSLEDLSFEKKQTDVNELMVLDSLVEACKATIAGYPTTEEQDSVIMNDPGMFRALSKTQRMAVKHRRQEKIILRRTIAAVTKDKEKLRIPLGGLPQ
eukprot:g5483.t1